MEPLTRRLEALLFISPHPVPVAELATACDCAAGDVEKALRELAAEYGEGRHGVELAAVGGGHTFRVTSECEEAVRTFAGARRPEDLSPALVEALSVVAYLQPTTRAEVAQVRGVSSDWALAALGERGLVEECGRAETPGSPILYRTTARFLKLFGLHDLSDLPPLENYALGSDDVEELRVRLLANAERRTP